MKGAHAIRTTAMLIVVARSVGLNVSMALPGRRATADDDQIERDHLIVEHAYDVQQATEPRRLFRRGVFAPRRRPA